MYRGLFDEPVCEPNDANIGPADEAAAPDTFEAAMQAPPVYLD